jgi:hypothetical protein
MVRIISYFCGLFTDTVVNETASSSYTVSPYSTLTKPSVLVTPVELRTTEDVRNTQNAFIVLGEHKKYDKPTSCC